MSKEPLKEVEAEEPFTQPQLMPLKLLGKELNLSREGAEELLKENGVASTIGLTKKREIELIGKLAAMKETP